MMEKVILLNGLITAAGLLIDVYGLCDLSFPPAFIGLTIGVVDCITFVWMREEIKEAVRSCGRSDFPKLAGRNEARQTRSGGDWNRWS
jgi:hypothetical protein